MYFVQGGKIIKKRNFIDPSSGEQYPIFEEYRDIPPGLIPDGTVVDPTNIAAALQQSLPQPPENLAVRPSSVPTEGGPEFTDQNYGTPTDAYSALQQQRRGGAVNGSPDFDPNAMRAAAQAMTSGQSPAAGAPGAAPAPGTPGTDWGRFGNAILYDPDNAKMAVQNVLKDMGVNPMNPGNLIAQMIMRASPGLGLAFQAKNAVAGNMAPNATTDYGDQFKQFLSGNIGGGSVLSTLGSTAQALPGIIAAIRNVGQDQQGVNVNPFAQALLDTLGANSGEGTIAALSALNGPMMPRSLMQGYQKGLQGSLLNALRSGVQDDTFGWGRGERNDIWKYLLGV
jgi:hypothetical protein